MFDGTQYNSGYLQYVIDELARREFREFVAQTKPDYVFNWHHEYIISKLQDFADGKIKNLAIFMPPQTGKSEVATRRLPAYILGKMPDKRVGVLSYNADIAVDFNRQIQRIMIGSDYRRIFPDTRLSEKNVVSDSGQAWKRNAHMFEIVERRGYLVSSGVNGPLTSLSIDVLILDDTVKNRAEAMSIAIQSRNNNWWDSVAKTRLDNDSQILMVNTRWDGGDLAGYTLSQKGFDFEVIVLPGLKVNNDDPNDPREIGDALWPEKHSKERYENDRESNPVVFEALYQQNPGTPTEVLVYPKTWHEIAEMPGYPEFWGLDFGFSAPSALARCMIKENKGYIEEKLYKTGLSIDELAAELKAAGVRGNTVYCDSAEPRTILDLRKRGINAVKANKELIAGILYMQSLDISYTRSSVNLKMEKGRYQYPTGGDNLPVPGADPIDRFNHLMDCSRYAFYTKASKPVPSFDIV